MVQVNYDLEKIRQEQAAKEKDTQVDNTGIVSCMKSVETSNVLLIKISSQITAKDWVKLSFRLHGMALRTGPATGFKIKT